MSPSTNHHDHFIWFSDRGRSDNFNQGIP